MMSSLTPDRLARLRVWAQGGNPDDPDPASGCGGCPWCGDSEPDGNAHDLAIELLDEIERLRAIIALGNQMMGTMKGPQSPADDQLWLSFEMALADLVNEGVLGDIPMVAVVAVAHPEPPAPPRRTAIAVKNDKVGAPIPKPPAGYQTCNVCPGDSDVQISHLVKLGPNGGTPGPTRCGLTRFDDRDPIDGSLRRKADLPGWGMGGGVYGPGVAQEKCAGCWTDIERVG